MQRRFEEAVLASASQDRAPRVAVVLSSFRGGEDHFGNKVTGLPEPRALSAQLTSAQVDAMVRKAIELGNLRGSSLVRVIAPEDWVLVEARSVDPRIVRSLVSFVAEQKRAGRITIAAPERRLQQELAAKYPKTRFECLDLAVDEHIELPVPGATAQLAKVPKTIQQCDKRIVIAPLWPRSSLTIGSLDTFSFHPAEFAMLGGRNVLVAGMNAVSVDAVGCALLGASPQENPLLQSAEKKGYGVIDLDSIWVRGVEIEDARKELGSLN